MAYIGNKADVAFTSLLKQDLTGASGATLTLSHAVANENDIALYINNVRQEPISAYTASNVTVNLTGTVSGTDDIYVIYLARAIQTTVPPDGSVSTAKIADTAVTNAKIANSTIDLTTKVTGVLPGANGGLPFTSTTRPAFQVQITSSGATNSSNVFSNTRTIMLNQGSHWQASGTNEGKFVAPVAGLYYFQCQGVVSDGSNQNAAQVQYKLHFTKNGNTLSEILGRLFYGYQRYEDHQTVNFSEIAVLAANDAIGVRVEQGYMNSGANSNTNPMFLGYFIG